MTNETPRMPAPQPRRERQSSFDESWPHPVRTYRPQRTAAITGFLLLAIAAGRLSADPIKGDSRRGAELFRQCAACHSTAPGQHLTGPSRAHIWGQRAGTVEGFERYSEALPNAHVVWTAETLDRWLKDPQTFTPGNLMTFPGVPTAKDRADLIAYLRAVSEGQFAESPPSGRGMMGGGPQVNLKALGKDARVRSIRYCNGSYYVTTEAGKTRPYWEFNLRFKTDSGPGGPERGQPVLMPAGMMGDRAFVVFASPAEISLKIEQKCPSG